ncbi:hypothetical protein B0T20DRAFT_409182 [Sordaria brevicollis]|uniref:Uncharacterized protein n=1 Tax=Sordaria brevicollis TaxID=83679 RepID=A0AAE0PFV9_SORBR|nr:hypothetical protein B0T20DRAFT_409182 [Sordaria brevicollis]
MTKNMNQTKAQSFATTLSHAQFHEHSVPNSKECIALLETHGPSIIYLRHESVEIKLMNPKGPRTKFKIFGSPGTPGLGDKWAFGYERGDNDPNYVPVPDAEGKTSIPAEVIWSSIPMDTDILITHTPPYGHCDLGVVRGVDGEETGETGKETDTDTCNDRHIGCYSLLQRLSVVRPRLHICGHVHRARGAERVLWSPLPMASLASGRQGDNDFKETAWTVSSTETWTDSAPDPKSAKISLVDLTGRGGNRELDWSDNYGAASGGEGRRETCIVNCAILASNYPHAGGKKFHKPVVVDLELPVCGESP